MPMRRSTWGPAFFKAPVMIMSIGFWAFYSKRKRHTGDTKQIKEKNIIKETTTNVVAKKDAAKAATLSRKESFNQSLVPYVGQYPKEMIRAFFDYWSELNKSETKMRYELEKTWELPRRLATWASREKVPSKTDVGIVLKDNSPGKYKKGW
jgi:galactose-1-phosphate uridylyltransferase